MNTPAVYVTDLKDYPDTQLVEVREDGLRYTEFLAATNTPGYFLIIRDGSQGPLIGKHIVGAMHIKPDGTGMRQDFWIAIDLDF